MRSVVVICVLIQFWILSSQYRIPFEGFVSALIPDGLVGLLAKYFYIFDTIISKFMDVYFLPITVLCAYSIWAQLLEDDY